MAFDLSNVLNKFKGTGPLAALESPLDAGSSSSLLFPPDEINDIDHWITFRVYKSTQVNRTEDTKQGELASIVLPMPANLGTGYSIGYSDENLGPLGNILVDAFGNTPTSRESAAFVRNAGVGAGLGALAGGLLGKGAASGAAAGLAGAAIATVGYDAATVSGGTNITSAAQAAVAQAIASDGVGKAILANSGGVAVNPHRVVLFEGIGFRDHSFSYQFSPKSYSEAEILRKVIRAFKYHSAPGYAQSVNVRTENIGGRNIESKTPGKYFFEYPEFFLIEFHQKDHLFTIAPSVLTRFSVDYHPLNTPAYAREEGQAPTPVQINISMSFQETEIVTKEAIDKGR